MLDRPPQILVKYQANPQFSFLHHLNTPFNMLKGSILNQRSVTALQ